MAVSQIILFDVANVVRAIGCLRIALFNVHKIHI